MIWVSWRRQRPQLITLLAMLVLGAGAIALLRSTMIDTIRSLQITQCVTVASEECMRSDPVMLFRAEWTTPLNMGQGGILVLPVLIGVFIGAPLFAKELEQGTHVLAFTQSISRTRWMFSKLAVALLPALVVLIALQSLVSWWLSAAGRLGPRLHGPFYALNFGIEHVSPAAYALFAFALGTFIGVVSRRTLVAMTVALGGFAALRFVMFGLMGRLIPAEHLEVAAGGNMNSAQGGLLVDSGWIDTAGRRLSNDAAYALMRSCEPTPNSAEQYARCWDQNGLAKQFSDFVSLEHAWQLHLAEAAIFGGLAVVLLAGTGWALRRQS